MRRTVTPTPSAGPLRALFVVDGLAGGGAERTVLRLASEMAGRGHEVALATLRDEQAYPIPAAVELIEAFDSGPRRFRKVGEVRRRARILDGALANRGLWHLVVSTLPVSDRITAASGLARSAWYRIANPQSVEQLEGAGAIKGWRRRNRLRATYDGRRIIAISAGVGRDLTERAGVTPARLEVIHNPFDLEEIRRLSAEPCPMAGRDYVVSVGRFSPQKRYDRVLGAFARASYGGRLVIVGTGTGEQIISVAERARALGIFDRLDLVGFHENPYPFMRHARALVLGSDFEGFGNVIVEALACGTPVASTRCPHGPEEILTGDLAVGLADLSEASLAEAIDRVTGAPPAIPEGHLGRFDVGSITDRYLELTAEPGTARA